MKTIHKQELRLIDKQTLRLPKGAKVLSVDNQNERIMVWYLFGIPEDGSVELEQVTFRIIGTGHQIEDNFQGEFIWSVITQDSRFVWHVFVEK